MLKVVWENTVIIKLDKKITILAQTTQQLATFSKKMLITGTLTGKHASNQYDMKNWSGISPQI